MVVDLFRQGWLLVSDDMTNLYRVPFRVVLGRVLLIVPYRTISSACDEDKGKKDGDKVGFEENRVCSSPGY